MNKYKFSLLLALVLLFTGCTKVWEEHTKVNDNVLQENLLDYLESNANFSEFTKMVKSSGMDNYLSSSGIFTVWAPTNQAIASIDQSLISTDEKIKLFVTNHIISGMYSTLTDKSLIKLKMKSGKVLQYDGGNDLIDGINIKSDEEITLKNGDCPQGDKA